MSTKGRHNLRRSHNWVQREEGIHERYVKQGKYSPNRKAWTDDTQPITAVVYEGTYDSEVHKDLPYVRLHIDVWKDRLIIPLNKLNPDEIEALREVCNEAFERALVCAERIRERNRELAARGDDPMMQMYRRPGRVVRIGEINRDLLLQPGDLEDPEDSTGAAEDG